MRIKEVEQRTGLTAKAIRLYESKGLLKPARETENDYRDYTEEDVARLKTIAILRKLDVPVKTIKEWTDGENGIHEILQAAAEENREASRESEVRHKLASQLAELVEENPERDLGEAVDDLEELNGLLEELNKVIHEDEGHIGTPLYTTLISLGPILCTVFGILNGAEKDSILLGFGLSLVAVLLCAASWRSYLKTPRSERRSSGCLPMVLGIVALLVGIFAFIVWLTNWQVAHFTADPSDILLQRNFWLLATPLVTVIVVVGCLYALLKKEKWVLLEKLPRGRGAKAIFAAVLVALNLLAIRCVMMSVSVATVDGIMRYTLLNPEGTFYAYTDVETVETGFKGKFLGFPVRSTGDFYYEITYSDGVTENWGDCSTQSEEESWTWMYRLDEWCRSGGAEKIGSDEFSEYCEMEQFYVDILIDVVNAR